MIPLLFPLFLYLLPNSLLNQLHIQQVVRLGGEVEEWGHCTMQVLNWPLQIWTPEIWLLDYPLSLHWGLLNGRRKGESKYLKSHHLFPQLAEARYFNSSQSLLTHSIRREALPDEKQFLLCSCLLSERLFSQLPGPCLKLLHGVRFCASCQSYIINDFNSLYLPDANPRRYLG